jgi:hypothetical protein
MTARAHETHWAFGHPKRATREDLQCVNELARTQPAPAGLAVEVLLLYAQGRGLSMSVWEAQSVVNRILAAERIGRK